MNIPRLEVFLDKESTLCVAKIETPKSEPRLIIDIPIEELRSLTPEDAAYRVGGTILNILGIWHKQAFENWKVPSVSERDKPER